MTENLNKKTKSDVKATLNVMLKRINNKYSFGGWLDLEDFRTDLTIQNELDNDFVSGFIIKNNQGLVCFIIYAGFTFWSKDNVTITTTIERHSPPCIEVEYFDWVFLNGGDYLLDKKEYCKNGFLTKSDWKKWGLNSYLIKAIYEFYEHR